MTDLAVQSREVVQNRHNLSTAPLQLSLPELDAITAEDLDGWSPEAITDWLRRAVPQIQQAERRMDAMRRATGLFLWKLRSEVDDTTYTATLVDLATETGVAVRTIRAWRTEAQKHYSLPAADDRALGQQKRREDSQESSREADPEDLDAREIAQDSRPVAPEERESEPESRPTGAQARQSGATGRDSSDVDGEEAPEEEEQGKWWAPRTSGGIRIGFPEEEGRPVAPPTPPPPGLNLSQVPLADLLAEVRKRKDREWADVPMLVVLDVKKAAARAEVARAPQPTRRALPGEQGKCNHPVNRRIGNSCGACGDKLGRAS